MKKLTVLALTALSFVFFAKAGYAELDAVETGAGAEGVVTETSADTAAAESSDTATGAAATTNVTPADPADEFPSTTASEAVAAPADQDASAFSGDETMNDSAVDTDATAPVVADTSSVPAETAAVDTSTVDVATDDAAADTASDPYASDAATADTAADASAPAQTDANNVASTTDTQAAATEESSVIRGTVVAVDMAENEITVRDDVSGADRRIDVDPNVMSTTSLSVGDNVRVDLSPSNGKRAQGVRITNE